MNESKPKRNRPVTVMTDDQMFAALDRAARRAGKSKSAMIWDALSRAIPEWAAESDSLLEEIVRKINGDREVAGIEGRVEICEDGGIPILIGLSSDEIKMVRGNKEGE